MPTVLITSMGGAGSRNLVETMRLTPQLSDYKVIGTHFDPLELAKSDLDDLFVVPKAADRQAYLDAHFRLFERFDVDVLIANSDAEVASFATVLDKIPVKHLLPPEDQTAAVQDKYRFYEILRKRQCHTVLNVPVKAREQLREAVASFSDQEKFWIRLKQGSGSVGATWLTNVGQAEKWIDLWCDLRDFKPTDFIISEFLPGRDFNVSALYCNGKLVAGKVYERLSYWHSAVSMSGMGSTPNSSVTVDEPLAIERTLDAVNAVCAEYGALPHGLYNADLKCNAAGEPFVTEINIGRFPMTSPQHDRIGKYNLLALYLQMLLDPERPLPQGEFDTEPGIFILRGPDMPVVFAKAERIEALKRAIP